MYGAPGAHSFTLQKTITLLHYITKDCHPFTLRYKTLSPFYITLQKIVTLLRYTTEDHYSFTLQKSITLLHYITKENFHCPTSRGVQHQDPAAFDQRFIDIVKQPLMTRYRLLPYLYTLLYKAHLHGDTVMRPLLFE